MLQRIRNSRQDPVPAWLVALLFWVAGASVWGQQAESPVPFRVSSELVLIELIVTDGQGNFVPDIDSSEIEVREDGKKQQIRHFELIRLTGAASSSLGIQSDAQGTPELIERREPASADSGVLVVIALDLASIGPLPIGRVKQSVADFIRNHLAPQDRVMLATIASQLKVEQSATTDHARILERIDGLKPDSATAADETSLGRFMDEIENLFRLVSITTNKQVLKDSVSAFGKNLITALERRLASSSQSLGLLARSLRPVQGRKHIVLYTAGYPMNAPFLVRDIIEQRLSDGFVVDQELRQHLNAVLGGVQKEELHSYLQKLIDEANRSQVSFYTVDARGLIALSAGGESSVRGLRHSSRQGVTNEYLRAEINEPQEYLRNLAGGTGGLAFLNSNDLQKGLARSYRDLHEHYLIGYRPETKRRKGKFHQIKISLNRPDVSLRYRRGYFEGERIETKEREISDALQFPSLFRAFPISIETAVTGRTLNVYTLVPTGALAFEQKGKKYKGGIEIFAILVDEAGNRVGDELAFAKRYTWEIDQAQLEQLRQGDNVVSAGQTAVPKTPGAYRVIVAVRRSLDGAISTQSLGIEF